MNIYVQGEESFIGDELVYGGVKGEMKNSIDYRESRYFKADNEACCRYYFVTICYGNYVEEILQELSVEPTDIIVMNSCLWDVHRHGKKGIEQYEQNLEKLVAALRRLLPDCLFIWLTTPPVHIKSKGGFLMRPGTDMVKINEVKFCNEIAREVFTNANNIDRRFRIVDLDAVFKYFEHHRAGDGVHWNERAHRRMSNMILEEVSKAFNKSVPRIIGRYDAMGDEGNQQYNQYENFNDPHQPPGHHWGEDHDMGWGPHYSHEQGGHNEWNQPPPYHENGWGHGPMGPPLHEFPPYGMPFGPPPPLPPALCPELDDLGQARSLVEYREECRKRKGDNDNESAAPKKYRFGGANVRKNDSKKLEDGKEQNVTVVEADGVMKKLVELSDGVVCHAVMTDEEIKKYKDKQEKDRLAKIKKEKEEEDRKEKQRLEEKRKKEAEEKAKLSEKVKDIDVSQLPIVSEIPNETETKNENPKPVGVSKIASKLLSFIKNPIDTIKGSKKSSPVSETPPTFKLSSPSTTTISQSSLTTTTSDTSTTTNVVVASVTVNVPSSDAIINKTCDSPITNTMMEIDSSLNTLKDTKPTVIPPSDEKPTEAGQEIVDDKNNFMRIEPPKEKTVVNSSSSVVSAPDPLKPVDTFALLSSLSSPFAKPKSKLEPPPSLNNKSTLQSTSKHNTSLQSKHQDEDSLLDGDESDSDVDESILEEKQSTTKPEKKTSVKTVKSVSKTSTPAKQKAKVVNKSPQLPTVSKKDAVIKKKKKTKHPGETKEERKLRKAKKKERKEKVRAEKESKKNQPEVLQSISTVTGNVALDENAQWNTPIPNHDIPANRVRSATWAPSYYPTYNTQPTPQPQLPTIQQQQQQHHQTVVGHRNTHQQTVYANNPLIQHIAPTTPQPQQQITPTTTKQQQLYIDEYGQTYTLEEETYVVGPTGQYHAVNQRQVAATYPQQHPQQQQQQFPQTSPLIYGHQQVRFI